MDPFGELGFRLIPRVGRLPRPLWSPGFRPFTRTFHFGLYTRLTCRQRPACTYRRRKSLSVPSCIAASYPVALCFVGHWQPPSRPISSSVRTSVLAFDTGRWHRSFRLCCRAQRGLRLQEIHHSRTYPSPMRSSDRHRDRASDSDIARPSSQGRAGAARPVSSTRRSVISNSRSARDAGPGTRRAATQLSSFGPQQRVHPPLNVGSWAIQSRLCAILRKICESMLRLLPRGSG